jgi:hypothetical protein
MTLEARIASLIPLPAWLAGVLTAAVLTATGLWLHALSGVFPLAAGKAIGITPQAHVTLPCATLIGYGLAAARMASETGAPATMTPRCWLFSRLAGAAGVVAGLILIVLTSRQIGLQEPGRNPWNAGELYVDVLSLLLLWGLGRAAYFTFRGAGANEYRSVPVDLWNATPLQRYGRRGLRNALAWSLGISLLVIIMFFDPNPGLQVDSAKVLLPLVLGSIGVAALSLFLPLWTLKNRLQAEKSRTLDGIDKHLRRIRDNRLRGKSPLPGTEADLIARRTFISGISEWAIDTGSFRKLSIYLFLPAGSWFVGPILRKMMDTVFVESVVRSLIQAFR